MTGTSKMSLAIAVFTGALIASPAQAGLYFGGAFGQASSDLAMSDFGDGSALTGSVEDTDTGWKVFGGMKVLKFFAVEAAWEDLGQVSADLTSDGSGAVYAAGAVNSIYDAEGYSLAALATLPVGPNFRLFAKVGYLFWDANMTITNGGLPSGSLSASDSGNDPIYGAGLVWDYAGPGQMRFEYEQSDVGGMNVSSLSAGLSFRF